MLVTLISVQDQSLIFFLKILILYILNVLVKKAVST